MVNFSGWELEEPSVADTAKFDMLIPTVVRPKAAAALTTSADDLPHEVGIIRQFTFSSALARMSVITRTLDGQQFTVYTKGAPEKMVDLCSPHSVPASFQCLLERFTVQGFRVIALAYRHLPKEMTWLKVQKIKRELVETDLVFLGFLVMQNTLKPETAPVIQELHQADIKTVMVRRSPSTQRWAWKNFPGGLMPVRKNMTC